MKKLIIALVAALALAGCSSVPRDVVTTTTPAAEAPSKPAPTPTVAAPPATPAPTELVVTLYGTDASFIYSADGTTIQQLQHQTGPFTFTMPYAGKPVFVNASAAYGGTADVGCTVTIGDRVVMDKNQPNQMAAICQGKVG